MYLKNKNILIFIFCILIFFITLIIFNNNNYINKLNYLININNEINFKKEISANLVEISVNEDYQNHIFLSNDNKTIKYKYLKLKFDNKIPFNQIPLFINYKTKSNLNINLYNLPISSEIFMKIDQKINDNNIIIRVVEYEVEDEIIKFNSISIPRIFEKYLLSVSDITPSLKSEKIFPFSYYYQNKNDLLNYIISSIRNIIKIDQNKKMPLNHNKNFILKNKNQDANYYKENFLTQYHSQIHYNDLYISEKFKLLKNQKIKIKTFNEYGNTLLNVYFNDNLIERLTSNNVKTTFTFNPPLNGDYYFKLISEQDKYTFPEINFTLREISY